MDLEKSFFLNGHGGNEPMMHQATQDLAVRYPVWTAAASYWSIARSALEAAGAPELGRVPGHAGGFDGAGRTAGRQRPCSGQSKGGRRSAV